MSSSTALVDMAEDPNTTTADTPNNLANGSAKNLSSNNPGAVNEAFEDETTLEDDRKRSAKTASPAKSPAKSPTKSLKAWSKSGSVNTDGDPSLGLPGAKQPYDEEGEAVKAAKRARPPLWYCKHITKWPKLSFGVTLSLHLLMMLITALLAQQGYDIIPIVFDRIPLDIRDDTDFLRALAWSNRADGDGIIARMGERELDTEPERTALGDAVTVFFEIEGGNVLTPYHLFLMDEVEEDMWGNEEFQMEYCMRDSDSNCVKPNSLMRYFDGTYSAIDKNVFRDYSQHGKKEKFNNYKEVLNMAHSNDRTKERFEWFLGVDSEISGDTVKSAITRMTFYLGLPYKGYKNSTDKEDEQKKKLEDYLRGTIAKKMDDYYAKGKGPLAVIWNSIRWLGLSIQVQVFADLALAGGSLAFIIIFMIIQTGSLWVGLFAILSIITSFFGANIVYRCIFDYRYFGIFHVLAIFIILGIGADDVFVFFDTWKETSHHRYPSLAHRLSDCYRKASLAMLFTSLTTALAFVVSATSPFIGINTFGLFAALLIIVNYLSVIIYFPNVVIMYHLYFEKYKCCCCCPRPAPPGASAASVTSAEEEDDAPRIPPKRRLSTKSGRSVGTGPIVVTADSPRRRSSTKQGASPRQSPQTSPRPSRRGSRNPTVDWVGPTFTVDDGHRKNPVVRFFRGPYHRLVTHRILRWVLLLVFVAVIAVFAAFAAQIRVNEEQPSMLFYIRGDNITSGKIKFLPDDSNNGKYLAKSTDAFRGSGGRVTTVTVAWGLKNQDLSECHRTDPECVGKVVWDDTFDMSSADAQKQVKAFCEYLRNLPDDRIEELAIKRNIVTNTPEVDCFIDKMEKFYQEEESRVSMVVPGGTHYPANTQLDLPWLEAEARTITKHSKHIYDSTKLFKDGFGRYFEVALSFWLYNGFQPGGFGDQFGDYNSMLGEADDPPYTITNNIRMSPSFNLTYKYGTRLRFMAVVVNTTINSRNIGYPKGLPIAEAWEKLASEQISQMTASLQGGFQSCGLWHWLKVQRELASSAVIGMGIGLAIACPILILATMNIIVGLLATFTICLITVSVVGVIPMAGWKLGVLESLNLVLVVGLAVDYVVHLAEGYARSPHRDRSERLRDTLEEVGISVLSGAVTTLGASMFLLLAKILFFQQFGLFMFSTIGLSIFYALGLFIVLLGLIGPQGDTGSLKALFAKCCKNRGKKKENVETLNANNNSATVSAGDAAMVQSVPPVAHVQANQNVNITFMTPVAN